MALAPASQEAAIAALISRIRSGGSSASVVHLRDRDAWGYFDLVSREDVRTARLEAGGTVDLDGWYGYDRVIARWDGTTALYSVNGGAFLDPRDIPEGQRLMVAQAFVADPADAAEVAWCDECFEGLLGDPEAVADKNRWDIGLATSMHAATAAYAGVKLIGERTVRTMNQRAAFNSTDKATKGVPTPSQAQAPVTEGTPVGSALKSDVFHRAPAFVVDDIAANGSVFRITGGDGVQRNLVQMPGVVDDIAGRFEWIVDDLGNITHQLFVKGGSINGGPITP